MAESKNAQMEEKLFKFPLLVWIRRCLNLSATLSQPLYCVALPLCMCLSLSVCVCLSVCVLASLVLADSTNKLALSIIKQQLIGVSLSASLWWLTPPTSCSLCAVTVSAYNHHPFAQNSSMGFTIKGLTFCRIFISWIWLQPRKHLLKVKGKEFSAFELIFGILKGKYDVCLFCLSVSQHNDTRHNDTLHNVCLSLAG